MHDKLAVESLNCQFKNLVIRELAFSKNCNCLELTALYSGSDNFQGNKALSGSGFKFNLLLIDIESQLKATCKFQNFEKIKY